MTRSNISAIKWGARVAAGLVVAAVLFGGGRLIENSERLAVVETSQISMKEKLDEIHYDVRQLLDRGRK